MPKQRRSRNICRKWELSIWSNNSDANDKKTHSFYSCLSNFSDLVVCKVSNNHWYNVAAEFLCSVGFIQTWQLPSKQLSHTTSDISTPQSADRLWPTAWNSRGHLCVRLLSHINKYWNNCSCNKLQGSAYSNRTQIQLTTVTSDDSERKLLFTSHLLASQSHTGHHELDKQTTGALRLSVRYWRY